MNTGSVNTAGRHPVKTAARMIGSSLRSRWLALFLFFACASFAVYGTLAGPAKSPDYIAVRFGPSALRAARLLGIVDTFSSGVFIGLLALLCLNIAWCTLSRFRRLAPVPPVAWLDLAVHAAVIVVLAGGAVKNWKSFVGTRNIAVGLESDTVDDADSRRQVPLGFTIAVTDQQKVYYPHRVRIGVSRVATGVNLCLMELHEGQGARVPGEDLEIVPGRLDRDAGTLSIAAKGGGGSVELIIETRPGGRTRMVFGPFELTLVSYSDKLKSVRSRIVIRENGRDIMDGWLVPNGRLSYRGTSLFQTTWGTDRFGNPYTGIQVTRDPGALLFWVGCILFTVTLPVYLAMRRRSPSLP